MEEQESDCRTPSGRFSFLEDMISRPFGYVQEFERYMAEDTRSYLNVKDEDIPKWWTERKSIYPTLYRLAKKFLSIQASSVPSERLFSQAGDVIKKERSRLDPHLAADILFSRYSVLKNLEAEL